MNRKGPGRNFGKKTQQNRANAPENGSENIHRRNVRLVAFPVIILFELIRYLAFQLWVLTSYACHHAKLSSETKDKKKAEQSNTSKKKEQRIEFEMSHSFRPTSPGAGEPALSKQKSHHRKAFECISKALKLDEEDEGKARMYFIYVNKL